MCGIKEVGIQKICIKDVDIQGMVSKTYVCKEWYQRRGNAKCRFRMQGVVSKTCVCKMRYHRLGYARCGNKAVDIQNVGI